MKKDVICLGNITLDDVVLWDGTIRMGCFGGDAIYASISALWWSDEIGIVAPIGADYPKDNLSVLQKSGWDLSGMAHRSQPTIRNWVIYENDGRRTWILRTDPDNFEVLSPTIYDIPPEYLESKSFLLLAMGLEAQYNLITRIPSENSLIVLDLEEDSVEANKDRILRMLAKVNIFMPSEIEAYRLSGHQDNYRSAREFAKLGCEVVVIKLGAKGSLIYDKKEDSFFTIPICPAQVKDTTGAGDSYCGGFTAMFVKTKNLYLAALAGTVSSSFTIQDFGLNHMFTIDKSSVRKRFKDFAVSLGYEELLKEVDF